MRKARIPLFLLLLGAMALVLLRPAAAGQAAREGLLLCYRSVIPALFPFFVLSSLFISLGYADAAGRVLAPVFRRLFHVSGVGGSAFFLGILGGYPMGARTVGQLYREGACDKREAERLLAFCNNSGPAFILGIAGEQAFASSRAGVFLYLIHVLAALLTGILLRGRGGAPRSAAARRTPLPFSRAFVGAVQNGFSGILGVCGFVVFFSVLLRLIADLTGLRHGLFLGFWELTCGILGLRGGRWGFIWAATLLGWGGLSVHAQTAAMLAGTGLSLGEHLRGKLLQAAISFALAFFLSRGI